MGAIIRNAWRNNFVVQQTLPPTLLKIKDFASQEEDKKNTWLDKFPKIVNNIIKGWHLEKVPDTLKRFKWLLSVMVRAAFYYKQNQ